MIYVIGKDKCNIFELTPQAKSNLDCKTYEIELESDQLVILYETALGREQFEI